MSPATHHMSSKDLQQSDTDEFQQIQSTGSMEDTKNCLKSFMFPFMQARPVVSKLLHDWLLDYHHATMGVPHPKKKR